MKTYFSSDFHLGHTNVIRYDKRPFSNIDQMDKAIIDNYNAVVNQEDSFYFLGDFSFNKFKTEEYLQQLNGKLFFIAGNHDRYETIQLYKKYGTYLGEQKMISVYDEEINNTQQIVLNHYRMDVWNKSHRGVWHLYGHSHGSLVEHNDRKRMDVGIMNTDYVPLEFQQIKTIMAGKKQEAIDHHK